MFDFTVEFEKLIAQCGPVLVDQGCIVEIKYQNTELEIHKASNQQAFWTMGDKDSEWRLEYIGQRVRSQCCERIKQHLFRKSDSTESKLERVRDAVREGRKVAISCILVLPDFLITSVDQALIKKNKEVPG